MTDKDALRTDQSALLDALARAGADVSKPKRMRCPFHEDTHPSAGIYQHEDGSWKFKCLGCQLNLDVIDVLARIENKTPADVLRGMKETKPPARPPEKPTYPDIETMEANLKNLAATYRYSHPDSKAVEFVAFRIEPEPGRKEFLQAHRVGNGFSFGKPPSGVYPLYNRARVARADTIIVVEGEKCVHAAHDAGFVATTSPGGASNAKAADWTPLAGKTVYIWPDFDTNGEKYADDVQGILIPLRCNVHRISPAPLGLEPGGDIHDYLATNGGTAEDKHTAVQLVLGEAKPVGAASGLFDLLTDSIEGRRKLAPMPWESINTEVRCLLPGAMTALCGGGGSAKSLLISQAMLYWHLNDVDFAVYHLEHDRDYHLRRVLAQHENNSSLTVEEWIVENPDVTLEAFHRNEKLLHAIGGKIWDAPDKEINLAGLTDWLRDRAKEGRRVIVIDPITAADSGKEPWLADKKFVLAAKSILREHRCSLIVVTHPRTGAARKASTLMDDMAGGAAYARFTDAVLWLERHDKPRKVLVKCKYGGSQDITIDRSIQIRKCRDGRGVGRDVGFIFDPATLLFADQGIVDGEADE